MTAGCRLFALIPAAGHSRRMGRPKLSLPVGDKTVLECVVAAFRAAGVADVLVALAPHTADLAELVGKAGAVSLLLPEATPDMQATALAGLDALEERFRPGPHDGWFLVPADHPTLDPQIIAALIAAWRVHPEKTIFVPSFRGRRGHPTLVRWTHAAQIRQLPPGQGLNVYFREYAAERLELPVESETILADLDTPEDYRQLTRD